MTSKPSRGSSASHRMVEGQSRTPSSSKKSPSRVRNNFSILPRGPTEESSSRLPAPARPKSFFQQLGHVPDPVADPGKEEPPREALMSKSAWAKPSPANRR